MPANPKPLQQTYVFYYVLYVPMWLIFPYDLQLTTYGLKLRAQIEREKHAMSSPKKTLKPAPLLHPIFSSINIIKRYFTRKAVNSHFDNILNKYYMVYRIRATEQEEKHGVSSPKNDLKPAPTKAFIFHVQE